MKLLKKWWLWVFVIVFILVNLWISNDRGPGNPEPAQLRHSHIATH